MYPARFEYVRPESLEEALELLKEGDEETSILAGGQSLVPAMNLRMARPRRVIDINRLRELDYIRTDGGGVTAGALTRHRTLIASEAVRDACPLVIEGARLIGHPQIRHMGTLGGSVAHADPAAELPCLALALEAQIRARSAGGERTILANDFFKALFTTALRKDELLVEVVWPKLTSDTGWGFEELSRRPGDFALVAVAAVLRFDGDAILNYVRLGLAGVGPTAMRAQKAESALVGAPLTSQRLQDAAALASEEVEPESDVLASADYRRKMVKVFLPRAVRKAAERAGRPIS